MDRRVLSIQSHVVSGYVGNKAAVFPLQVLGYDVDAINTVHYSNHAGYRRFGGTKTTHDELSALVDVLRTNGLVNHPRLLTGFVPDANALQAVVEVAQELRRNESDKHKFIYLLDPVLGDDGRLYVSPDTVPIYRDVLLPLATIITPNWYEVEVLTGVELKDVDALRKALHILHVDRQVPHVVISSIPVGKFLACTLESAGLSPSPLTNGHDHGDGESQASSPTLSEAGTGRPNGLVFTSEQLLCLTSSLPSRSLQTNGEQSTSPTAPISDVHLAVLPKIKGYFSGVGDLFSALVLGHFKPVSAAAEAGSSPQPIGANGVVDVQDSALCTATSFALSTTQAILLRTNAYSSTLSDSECPPTDDEKDGKDPERHVKRMKARELRIIQGLDDILRPKRTVELRRWDGFWDSARETDAETTPMDMH